MGSKLIRTVSRRNLIGFVSFPTLSAVSKQDEEAAR